ncbi:unnamed protein product [Sphenostylis stenocarpa]|uniref:Uncharacterized protein n=1 Tax=Sphenostylis stenocarpa TaxID=92480 RepID=A0AA86SBH4_9FABA|nr:unnamed protein product [Sphenostylis stenocarpa]
MQAEAGGEDTKKDPEYIQSNPMGYSYSFRDFDKIKHDVFYCLLLVRAKIDNNNSSYPVTNFVYPNDPPHKVRRVCELQIDAFVDNKLVKGDGLPEALVQAIEGSLISLKKDGQIVLPVFYKVDPSHVRCQKGTYEDAFAKHEIKYSLTTMQTWRSALTESANLSGFHSSTFRDEAELIKEIVKYHDYSVVAGLERLKNKSLISVSQENGVSMHNIIQETAWQIAREESFEDPRSHIRLLDPEDIYLVLKYNKGGEAIRSIAINLSRIKQLELNPQPTEKALAKRTGWGLLECIHQFSLENLEKLDLRGCLSLRSLRSSVHLDSLRYLSLYGCMALKDFSVTSKNMVKLNLELTRIKQLPSSFRLQTKLQKLRHTVTLTTCQQVSSISQGCDI